LVEITFTLAGAMLITKGFTFAVASILVIGNEFGLRVIIFENAGFQGRWYSMGKDVPCLASRSYNGFNYNDQASSIIIERR
jgi:hypothetical protein